MEKHNRVAIVTGAGSGIGRAITVALCKEGWCIVLAGRREDMLLLTSKECEKDRTLVVPTDLNNPDSIKNLFEQTFKTFSKLDLLVNNFISTKPNIIHILWDDMRERADDTVRHRSRVGIEQDGHGWLGREACQQWILSRF